jgi:hypothetical protein
MVYISAIIGFVLVFATSALVLVGTEWIKSVDWAAKFRGASGPTAAPEVEGAPPVQPPVTEFAPPERVRAKPASGDGLADFAKTTSTPYWIDHQGGDRPGESIAIRFAFIAVDTWRGDPPRIDLDGLLDRDSGQLDDWAIRSDENSYPRPLRRQLRQAKLSQRDQATIDEMRSHPIGKLAYFACSTATAIELSRSWKHDILDNKMIRIDLDAEVADISRSCARLRSAVDKLGTGPPDDLGDDPDLTAIHAARSQVHDERLGVLIQRLEAFTRYRAGVEQVDRQLAKLEWVISVVVDDDSDEYVAAAEDELGSQRLNRAAEEFDAVAGAIIDTMLTDAKRLSRIVRYS